MNSQWAEPLIHDPWPPSGIEPYGGRLMLFPTVAAWHRSNGADTCWLQEGDLYRMIFPAKRFLTCSAVSFGPRHRRR